MKEVNEDESSERLRMCLGHNWKRFGQRLKIEHLQTAKSGFLSLSLSLSLSLEFKDSKGKIHPIASDQLTF